MKIVPVIVLVVACTQAQPFRDLLLPQARQVAGVVVDAEGEPVAGASIDHSNDRLKPHRTDSEGRFALDTRAPILVVRKSGFRSELVRTPDATKLRITLQKLNSPGFPICSSTGQYEGIEGWSASFQFPRVKGVKASKQVRDSDYGARSYYVDTKQGLKAIRHGSGPLWSFGTPLDGDVWRSVKYEEATFDVRGTAIIDARGQFPSGNHWRSLARFGESASYSDVDEATAKILDSVLDGACLTAEIRR